MVSVFGIGNPLLDFVAQEEFALIEALRARPGTMNLVTRERFGEILQRIRGYANTPGGSCANTIRGIAWLNRRESLPPPCYCGAVGRDAFGSRYIEIMQALGIRTRLARKETPSGCCLSIVTPDRERTMFTSLGACREFTHEDIDLERLVHSRVLHIAGYMWDTENQKSAVRRAVEEARGRGVRISFDLADPFVVQRERLEFLDWIPGRVDILFGNREELSLLLAENAEDQELVRRAGALAAVVAMKIGGDGCLIGERGGALRVPGFPVRAVDSTGAGDSFAAGFLFGLLRGLGTEESARLAKRLASLIVGIEGCDYGRLSQEAVLEGS